MTRSEPNREMWTESCARYAIQHTFEARTYV